jgi:chemotaxis protein MotA
MDFMTIIGLVAGIATVYYVMASGDILHMLFNPVAFILVFGGTVSATLIAYPWSVLKHAFTSSRLMFFRESHSGADRQVVVDQLVGLAEKARRQGVDSLQADINGLDDGFEAYGLQMVVDGLEHDVVRDNLEKDMILSRQHNQRLSGVFRTAATLAPIFGLLGTLIGVVQVLRNLSDPSSMGSSMAIAITTTFYGIFAANFIFLPISIKLGDHGEGEIMRKQLVTEGVLSIQKGEIPLIVRKKLNAFVLENLRGAGRPKKG